AAPAWRAAGTAGPGRCGRAARAGCCRPGRAATRGPPSGERTHGPDGDPPTVPGTRGPELLANGCPDRPVLSQTTVHGATCPGDPDGTGLGAVTIDRVKSEVCWDISTTNLDLPALAAHIHRGALNVNGPIVVNFTAPDATGASQGCTTVDPSLANEIATNPAG